MEKKCIGCFKIKKEECFEKSKKIDGGLKTICKTCTEEFKILPKLKNKICRICKIKKDAKYFHKCTAKKDGLNNNCAECLKIRYVEKVKIRTEKEGRKKGQRYTTETFREKLYELYKGEHELLDEYSCYGKMRMLHTICGEIKIVGMRAALDGGCKNCSKINKSGLSSRIENALRRIGACYETELYFDECKDKAKLPFDFGIFKNGELNSLIEADGAQHFKEAGYHNSLKDIQRRDEIKNRYCRDNNIPLLRINYLQENECEDIVYKNIEKGLCPKKPKKYFTRSGVTEEICSEIRNYYAIHGGSTTTLMKMFGLNREITLKVLYYLYFPTVLIELKDIIDENIEKERHPKARFYDRSLEEQEKILNKRREGWKWKDIEKEFDLPSGFNHTLKDKTGVFEIQKKRVTNGIPCVHIETQKKFSSVKDGCKYFEYVYITENKRIGTDKAKFEYI